MSDEHTKIINRIQNSTGQTIEEIESIILSSKLEKHSEIRSLLIEKFKLSYGDANTLTHYVMKSDGQSLAEGKSMDLIIDEIYNDKKIGLKPLYEMLMERIMLFGPFEILPKKGYVSLKRKRQFAMIGPKSTTRIEVGINLKSEINNSRFIAQAKGSMCQYIVNITSINEIDDELLDILKSAYEQSL